MNNACRVCEKPIHNPRAILRTSLLANLKTGDSKWFYDDRPIHMRCLDLLNGLIKDIRSKPREKK